MRIGSFFMILLVALIALGFLLSDSLHLREDIQSQRREIESLRRALQNVEQEKQNAVDALQTSEQEKRDALINLQAASQNLQTCNQAVDRANQLVSQLTGDIAYLKEENRLLVTQIQTKLAEPTIQQSVQAVPATIFGLFTVLVAGLGSVIMLVPRGAQKRLSSRKRTANLESRVRPTDEIIRKLPPCQR